MASLGELLEDNIDGIQDKWLLKSIDSNLKEAQRPARQGVFYPSALGSICDRYLYNCYNGLVKEEEISAVARRIFDCGDYLGYRYEKYFEKMDVLLETESVIKADDPPISGRLDFLISHPEHEQLLIELKSINQRGFNALKEPKPEHTVQIQIYLNLTGYQHGVVLYECKNAQKIKAFEVKKDPEHWKEIYDRCNRIMNMTNQPEKCTGYRYCACKREG